MLRPVFRLSLTAASAGAALLATGAQATTAGYLTWANKDAVRPAFQTQNQVQPVQQAAPVQQQAAPSYDIPPSPYGQVGYPFRTLGWSNKNGVQAQPVRQQAPPQMTPLTAPQRIASQIPVRSAPVQATPASAPPPPGQPRTITQNGRTYVLPSQPPAAIEPEDDGDYRAEVAAGAPPPAPPPQRVAAPVQQPRPASQPAPEKVPPTAGFDDGGYQVPSSSPYAARIAAARAAQGQQQVPQTVAPVTAADEASQAAGLATVPAAAEPLAAQETDHVFIPGEQWRSAADEPRFYSLHREYGYRPDPITVDRNASGALLEAHYDTDDGGDDKDSGDSKDDKNPSGDDTQ